VEKMFGRSWLHGVLPAATLDQCVIWREGSLPVRRAPRFEVDGYNAVLGSNSFFSLVLTPQPESRFTIWGRIFAGRTSQTSPGPIMGLGHRVRPPPSPPPPPRSIDTPPRVRFRARLLGRPPACGKFPPNAQKQLKRLGAVRPGFSVPFHPAFSESSAR